MSSIDAKKAEPEKPKTAWDSILTSTPVILTVIATLLAGLSSSEMTRAQYHRALAAQHQSKVSDQWNFFQAKRIRGTNMETEVELLHAQYAPAAVTPEVIAENAERMVQGFDRAAREAERLLQAVGTAKKELGAAGGDADQIQKECEKVLQAAKKNASEARKLKKQIDAALARPDMREALSYLTPNGLAEITKEPIGDENVREAQAAIRARRTETETAPLMARITEDELHSALEATEVNARAFDEKADPINKGLVKMAQRVQEAATLAGSFHRSAANLASAVTDLPAGGGTAVAEVRAAAQSLARTDAVLKKNADELNTSFAAAHRGYTARRYEREATDNREVAGVLEIQVRKSSWTAERHRSRSVLFFYGMLAAQAGVTIATFSLAVRQRSSLWALATLAGLGAILFSGYVYLYT